MDDAPTQAPPVIGRVLGIDVARAVAIVGMVMVHIGPTGPEGDVGAELYGFSHGRASLLFVLLAGVGVSLLAGDRSPARLRSAWLRLGYRALLLLPLGLALQLLEHSVLVILQYYALYFLVGAAAAALPDRVLLPLALAWMVLGPALYLAAWHAVPAWFETTPTAYGDAPGVVVRQLLLSGSYPVITWSAPLLFGVWLGRRDLRSATATNRMFGVGIVVAAAAWAASWGAEAWLGSPAEEPSWLLLATDDAHSQMPLWLIGGTAAATALLGLAVLAGTTLPRAAIWPLAATGQLAFTVYVGHLLVLHAWPDLLVRDEVGAAAWSVARFAVVTAVAAVAWLHVAPRGPLEAALRLPWTVRDLVVRGSRGR